jgi:hypothetical protein
VGAMVGLCGCDVLFGLNRNPDARIDTIAIDAPADTSIDGTLDATIDAPADAAIDAPPGAVCPATYGAVDITLPNRYRYVTTPAGWLAQENLCAADQIPGATRFTHLAVIVSDNERSRLTAQQPRRSWIGNSDRKTEMLYLWVTNEVGTLPLGGAPWTSTEPDHANAADDCVEMNGVADYAESDCAAVLPAWCECDASPVQPQNF